MGVTLFRCANGPRDHCRVPVMGGWGSGQLVGGTNERRKALAPAEGVGKAILLMSAAGSAQRLQGPEQEETSALTMCV